MVEKRNDYAAETSSLRWVSVWKRSPRSLRSSLFCRYLKWICPRDGALGFEPNLKILRMLMSCCINLVLVARVIVISTRFQNTFADHLSHLHFFVQGCCFQPRQADLMPVLGKSYSKKQKHWQARSRVPSPAQEPTTEGSTKRWCLCFRVAHLWIWASNPEIQSAPISMQRTHCNTMLALTVLFSICACHPCCIHPQFIKIATKFVQIVRSRLYQNPTFSSSSSKI